MLVVNLPLAPVELIGHVQLPSLVHRATSRKSAPSAAEPSIAWWNQTGAVDVKESL